MADENDESTPMRTEEDSDSGTGTGSGSGSESDSEEEQTEWLATTREKRSTAGNRMTTLLQEAQAQAQADDDLELLFEEVDDDAGFEDVEADSDVQMDSSDDDEDQGPATGADDLEGEKELQKKERAEKLRRKKLNDGMPKIFKRKVKIDPTATQGRSFGAPASRPKKKSERISWIPTPEDAPTRASQRGSTRQSKDELHKQMVDREIKRLKQLANMEKAAARKEAAKKPAMTQADRLVEAARVEKRNQKSLSRWEEAEQQREEEQLAKLAALSNRHMQGPVITMWSGMAEWVGGNLKRVGKNLELEDPKDKLSKKRKAAEMSADAEATGSAELVNRDHITISHPTALPAAILPVGNGAAPNGQLQTSAEQSSVTETPPTIRSPPLMAPPPMVYTSYPPTSQPLYPAPPPYSPITPPSGLATSSKPPSHPPFILAPPQGFNYIPPPMLDGSAPLPGFGPPPALPLRAPSYTTPFGYTSSSQLNQAPPPPVPPGPPVVEHAVRNCIILSNFDETAIKDKNVQMQIVFGRKFTKATKNKRDHELCAITSYPAKFRDPSTGLPYCSSYAYKEIQKLKQNEYQWSKLLGAYAGHPNHFARGVPPRFVDKNAERVAPVVPPQAAANDNSGPNVVA